jgi:hypothetical protein
MKEILFFRIQRDVVRRGQKTLPTAFSGSIEIWIPTLLQLKPKGFKLVPFGVWWMFHYTHIFKNRAYKIYLLRMVGSVVHRSCLFPPFFRFPFMCPNDLQIGDIWTAESERQQGLSVVVLNHILNDYHNRTIWFLCEAGNMASESLARSVGMELFGVGRRTSPLGIGVFGQFVVHPS